MRSGAAYSGLCACFRGRSRACDDAFDRPPCEIEENATRIGRMHGGRGILAWRPDDDRLGMRDELLEVLAKERRDMWNLALDVPAVRAHELRERHVAIENPHVAPFPDQRLHERDDGTLAQVVGAGFE